MLWASFAASIFNGIDFIVQTGPKLYREKLCRNRMIFKWQMNNFYENIGPTVLNPIDMEEAEKADYGS